MVQEIEFFIFSLLFDLGLKQSWEKVGDVTTQFCSVMISKR